MHASADAAPECLLQALPSDSGREMVPLTPTLVAQQVLFDVLGACFDER